jgi:GT2 family glycosyltransferase
MDISIIIVNYKSDALVRECIKSFKLARTHRSYEIIVVDNGGDGTCGSVVKQRFGDVHYFPLKKNLGLSAANNLGARNAQGTYLFFANPDITVHDGTLDTLYAFMEAHEDVGVCGPQLLNPDGSIQQSYYKFYSLCTPAFRRLWIGNLPFAQRHLNEFLMRSADLSRPFDTDFIIGACLFVRVKALERVGLMDEHFFLYFEDTDWCKRFWDAGWRVSYVPQAKVFHIHMRDSARRMGIFSLFHPLTRVHVMSGIKYFIKHWPNYARSSRFQKN